MDRARDRLTRWTGVLAPWFVLVTVIPASPAEAVEDPGSRAPRAAVGWTGPTRITPTGDVTSGPLVTAAPEGDVTVLWSGSRSVKSRTRQAGGTWGPVLRVGTGSVADVQADASGDVTVVWSRGLSRDRNVVMTATRPDGGSWSTPRRLSRIPRSRIEFTGTTEPHLDVSPDGAAVVAWSFGGAHGGVAYRAQASYRPAGGAWGRYQRIAEAPSLASDAGISPAGVPIVLVSDDHLRTARRTDDGWQRVGGSITGRRHHWASLEVGPGGHSVAVWNRLHRRDNPLTVHASRLVEDEWRAPVRLSSRRRYSEVPLLGVDGQGVGTVTWLTGRQSLKVSRWVPGDAPTTPRTVAREDADGLPVVAPGGDATIVGVRQGRDRARIFAVSRPAGGVWSARQPISTVRGYVYRLDADIWPGGRAVAVWRREGMAGATSAWVSWKR
jgi:hypothetical protein